jgi:hypothetical protein
MLGSEFLGVHFEEYYVITVLWDVRNLTFVVWEQEMIIPYTISEKNYPFFNFKHITPEMKP